MNIRGYRVFYLDPEEDINSLLTELKQVSAEKLALVVDQRSNVFNSKINLQLLQKYLKDWDKELVFVSQEMRLIRLVLESDLKLYPDLDALKNDEQITDIESPIVTSLSTEELLPELGAVEYDETEMAPTMSRSARRRKARWGRRIVVALFAIVLLAGLAWVYIGFPLVTVEVSPSVRKWERELEVICDYNLEQVRVDERKIPLITFNSDVEGQAVVATTGSKKIGFTRAEGVVLFANTGNQAITVPAGTVLRTGTGVKFKTVQEVTVPKVQVQEIAGMMVGTTVGTAEVNIVALEAGTAGNVSSGRITQFDGKDYGLQVRNPEATRDGKDREEPVVTQADLDRVISKLEEELKNSIKVQWDKEIGSDYLVLEDTLQYEMGDVKIDHSVDEDAEEITATGKILASGYLLLKDDLRVITEQLYIAEMPESYELYSSGIQISELQAVIQEDETIKVKLKTVGQVVAQIRSEEITEKLKGQTVEYADQLLRKMNEIRYFQILTGGKTRIPKFTFAIRVLVRNPTESEEGSI